MFIPEMAVESINPTKLSRRDDLHFSLLSLCSWDDEALIWCSTGVNISLEVFENKVVPTNHIHQHWARRLKIFQWLGHQVSNQHWKNHNKTSTSFMDNWTQKEKCLLFLLRMVPKRKTWFFWQNRSKQWFEFL
jgi:hypothetical protein